MKIDLNDESFVKSLLYDDVKTRHAESIKMRVMAILGGKTNYYRYNHGEKKLLPAQQQLIADLFGEYGYSQVVYEHTAEQTVLTDKPTTDRN